MKIFSKRETLLQNLALMGIMAAINIIVSVLIAFVPVLGLFLILVLPLSSVVVELYCKDRYYIIYALATVGLSIVATLWNIDTTIFYVVPSVLTGYIFGLSCKKNIPSIISILAGSFIQTGLMFALMPLIKLICQVDMFDTFIILLKIEDIEIAKIIFPLIIYVGSLIQSILSYIIISGEVKKFGYNLEINGKYLVVFIVVCLCLSCSIFGLMFLSNSIAYIFLIVSYYFASFIVYDYIKPKKWKILIAFSLGIIVTIIGFAVLYKIMPSYKGFMLFGVFPLWISCVSLIENRVEKYKTHRHK